MPKHRREQAELACAAEALRALGHPDRLRIVRALQAREACVCELVAALGLRQPAISQHLAVLRRARLVKSRRDGLFVRYRLNGPLPARLLGAAGLGPEGDRLEHADRCAPACQAAER
ncbi:ArsR/SmtB family transcription factor [Limnochorda pilosa]|uniref:ArsR family transcriptional regulator n=1 Tax=Limnochorda pilosa TaxID=1555112 RepID=A0A0K2SJT0_LIMPI|nr:metalloregulator ArsR/SmtB family transcription factor [Limnochorda pilosa]BAS27373.1 ArsR family transcriptional regulator [Limnochorda pilosa]